MGSLRAHDCRLAALAAAPKYPPPHPYFYPCAAAGLRGASLGMGSAAGELAAGILLGLYNCRDGNSETLLEYAPDFAVERASAVVSDCAKLGIELPAAELLDLLPAWSDLLT
jgi:hypothetical protein